MTEHGFIFFDTAIGRCALAWGARGIVSIQLPERSDRAALARMRRRVPEGREATPPPDVRLVLDRIVALLRGEPVDLTDVVLDMEGVAPFERRVYEVARAIPPGSTLSYGEIASRLGDRSAARDVGQALGRNPFAIVVPCHRVVAAGGKLGGFSARGGVATKLRMLAIERAALNGMRSLFDRA
jgi:methylated-DNA-[protein]-cysteine S-methyltransferase